MQTRNRIVATLAALAMTAAVALAVDGQTGNVILTGVVNTIREITVAGAGLYNALDVESAGAKNDVLVANVNELANVAYKVTLTSTKAGTTAQAFLEGGAESQKINYSIKYNDTAVTLVSGSAQVTTAGAKTVVGGSAKTIKISYTGRVDTTGAFLAPGSYTDTLTLAIAAP